MRRTRRSLALPAALGLLAALPITAQAQPELKLEVWDSNPGKGTYVQLAGCKTPTTATSPGFQSPIQLSWDTGNDYVFGHGTVVSTVGTYTATASCNGRVATAQFRVYVPVVSFLSPLTVEPGGKINGYGGKMHPGCYPSADITSPGFAAPMKMHMDLPGVYSGSTTVIMTPGTYTATKHCSDGSIETQNFTISGGTPTTPPATTTPPAPGPGKPKPPIVKPRGAADTGGGGTT